MIREGTNVRWKWADGHAEGVVKEHHTSRVKRVVDGAKVVRNGSGDDPALVIEQADGQTVVKLRSEVERSDKD